MAKNNTKLVCPHPLLTTAFFLAVIYRLIKQGNPTFNFYDLIVKSANVNFLTIYTFYNVNKCEHVSHNIATSIWENFQPVYIKTLVVVDILTCLLSSWLDPQLVIWKETLYRRNSPAVTKDGRPPSPELIMY